MLEKRTSTFFISQKVKIPLLLSNIREKDHKCKKCAKQLFSGYRKRNQS